MNNREYEDWDKIKEKESVNNFSDNRFLPHWIIFPYL